MERVRATWKHGIIVVRRSKKRHRQDWKDNPRRRIFFTVGLYVKYNMPTGNDRMARETTMMKSIVCDTPGSLRMEQRPVPVPAAGEVLVRIRRIGICGTDMHIFRGTQPFLSYPRVMGHELSGHIDSAPAGSRLAVGDQVVRDALPVLRHLRGLPPGQDQLLHPHRGAGRAPRRRHDRIPGAAGTLCLQDRRHLARRRGHDRISRHRRARGQARRGRCQPSACWWWAPARSAWR